MNRLAIWVTVTALLASVGMSACSDDDDGKTTGEPCETNDDCQSGSCVADADGDKTCSDSSGPGGW